MQILLHADPHIDRGHFMVDHLSIAVEDAMGRFGERVTRVEAQLSDVNGRSKPGVNDIHCTLEARLAGLSTVVAKEHASNAHRAIDGAVRKLKRAVGAEIARHDPRSQRSRPTAPAPRDDRERDDTHGVAGSAG
jgi:ribosome-associated translation inhibitor RaiA